jgi:hypothetical protein
LPIPHSGGVYYEKYLSGWNAKKATLSFTLTGKTDIRAESTSKDALNFGVEVEGEEEVTHGSSDSGSPIVNENNSCCVNRKYSS